MKNYNRFKSELTQAQAQAGNRSWSQKGQYLQQVIRTQSKKQLMRAQKRT